MINISFVICTYNSPELIKRAVESILRQKFKGKIEILLIDGGSDRETISLIEEYVKKDRKFRYFHNKEQFPEGVGKGKWLAWKNVGGEYVAIVDQDNELQGENWINEMLKPFEDEEIFGASCKTLLKKEDSLTNQYITLQGTDPALAYQSLDGQDLEKIGKDKGEYIEIEISKEFPLLTGGNCFIYRKSYLDGVGGYTKDTENIRKLVNSGKNKIAIPKKARTHHFAIKNFLDFVKKKKKWAKTYKKETKDISYLPKNKKQRRELIINFFKIFTIIPNVYTAFRKTIKTRQKAWLLHPLLTLITTLIYLLYVKK